MVVDQDDRRLHFDFVKPTSLDDALAQVRLRGQGTAILAGGTDLLVAMREKGLCPTSVVSLKHIPGLSGLDAGPDGGLRIGALVTLRALEQSPLVRERFPFLVQAASAIASVQIRNLATVAGNLCNASPAADMAPPLLTLDASLVVVGPTGKREIPLAEFFTGPGMTALDGEIVTEIRVPTPPVGWRGVYLKHGPRKAMDIAVAGVAVLAVVDRAAKRWKDIRIALGAVAPRPMRASDAEAVLRGAGVSPDVIARAAEAAALESRPITDLRGSADYRRAIVGVLVRRALETVTR